MATIAISGVGVARTISGGSPTIIYHQEGSAVFSGVYYGGASGDGFKKGSLLFVNSSNALEPMRGAKGGFEATGADAGKARIIGFAAEDATRTASNEIAIYAANANNVFYGNCKSTTSAATSTVSKIKIGEVANASMNYTGSQVYVNVAGFGAASSLFRIVGKYPDDAYGDTYGRYEFVVLPSRHIFD